MDYQLTGRNLEITDAMRAHTEEKLDKLSRFSEHIVDAKITMSYAMDGNSALPAKVEMQLNLPHGIVRAEENGADTYMATDTAVEKLERQLKRFKERKLTKRTNDAALKDYEISSPEDLLPLGTSPEQEQVTDEARDRPGQTPRHASDVTRRRRYADGSSRSQLFCVSQYGD